MFQEKSVKKCILEEPMGDSRARDAGDAQTRAGAQDQGGGSHV
jgi:hypothetical protein